MLLVPKCKWRSRPTFAPEAQGFSPSAFSALGSSSPEDRQSRRGGGCFLRLAMPAVSIQNPEADLEALNMRSPK